MKPAVLKNLRSSVTVCDFSRNLSSSFSKKALAHFSSNNKFNFFASSKKEKEKNSSNSNWKLFGSVAILGSIAAVSTVTLQFAVAEEDKLKIPKITKHYKYIIVGAGAAGFHALQEILKDDKDAHVLVVSNESSEPYNRTPLSKELWKSNDPNVAENLKYEDWSGKESSAWFQFEVEAKDRVTFIHANALDVNTQSKYILLDTGNMYSWDKILLATGGYPKSLPEIPEEVKDKVSTYRYLQDFKDLEKLSTEAKHIVVIGGGFLGSELACGLQTKGKNKNLKVTQVFPESGLMGLVIPKELSDYATNKIRKEVGVDIRPGTTVKKYENVDGKLKLTLSDGKVLDKVDRVVLSVGINPDTSLALDLEIDPNNGGIVVNSELAAKSDVYVAGDVASYWEPLLGRRRVEHYDHAVASGRIAGHNMAGKKFPYKYLPFFWSDIGPLGYEAVGILDAKFKKVLVFEKDENSKSKEFKRGVVYYLDDDRKIKGVLLWGVFGKTDEARFAIINSHTNKQYEKDEDLIKLVSLEKESH